MPIEFTSLTPDLADSQPRTLQKILARLNISASGDPAEVAQNVAVTNTPTVHVNNTSGDPAYVAFPSAQPISGTVTVGNQISGFSTEATLATLSSNFSTYSGLSVPYLSNISTKASSLEGEAILTNIYLAAGLPIKDATTGDKARVSDGHLSTLSVPLQYEVAHEGSYNGHVARQFHVMGRRAGFNSTSILQDVGEFLTGDIFPVLAGTEPLEVVSSAAADNSAGAGTRTVRIIYLDTSNDMQKLDVVMNGVTPVSLGAVRMKFVYSMEALTGGANEVSSGNIDLRVVAGAVIQERITAQSNRSLSTRFMVPRNYDAYVVGWDASTINADADVRLRATVNDWDRSLTDRYNFQDVLMLNAGAAGTGDLPWLKYPALCKLKISCLPGATAAANRITSGFTVLLVSTI